MHVLISGAGIGGPALAYWLRRYGHDVTVVERAPGLRAGGQAVDLRGAARGVAERMGIMPEVRAATVPEEGFGYVNAAGKVVVRMPAELFGGEGIVAEIEILRGDLARVLHEATRRQTEYLFGNSIASLTQHDGGVHVTFEQGPARTFDLVIGADGVHSRVRALAFGDESEFVRPLGAYASYFTVPDYYEGGPDDSWLLFYSVPGRRVAGIRPEHGRDAQAMFSFASPPLRYDRADVDQQKRLVAEAFAGVGWQVPRLLAAMRDTPEFYFDLYGQVHLDRWSRGRVALLGDAGYSPSPLTGLGTSLALVGAYVLAGELATADHSTAFDRYEQRLRGYVQQCQKLPPGGINGFLPRGELGIRLRNQSMRLMTARPFRGLAAKMFQKAEAIELPEYSNRTAPAPRSEDNPVGTP